MRAPAWYPWQLHSVMLRVQWWLWRAVCALRGCWYESPVFRSNRLYFCTRCKREMFGRSFEDLTPDDASSEWPGYLDDY